MPRDGITEPIEPSDAASVGYEPTTPGTWASVPDNVHRALDEARRGEEYISLYSGARITF